MRETPKAAAAYAHYEAMGPERSLAKLLEALRQSDGNVTARLRTLEEWSRLHNWQERVAAYDAAQRDRERAQREAEEAERRRREFAREERRRAQREKMDDERAENYRITGNTVLSVIIKRLGVSKDGKGNTEPDVKGIMGLTSLLKLALDEERLSLGSPTQIAAQQHSGNVQVHIIMPELDE